MLDPETNCAKSGPSGIHAILIDRSDPISEQQAQRIRQTIDKLKNDATFGLRFDIYTFQGDTTHALKPKLQICALGKPSDANEWVENLELVRRRYETKFANVLDQTISDLLNASSQSNSPIIESLRGAAISSFGSIQSGQIPLRVTMISDMIQNTPQFNQFQAEADFQKLSRSVAWPTLQPQLKGAHVDILYLLRLSAQRNGKPIQNRGHQAFWEQLIASSGGRVTNIDPL
ncbi:hypothetical protein NML43_20445 [Rhodopseudomonas palustris]|uniref:hypothetical protein n=1 Tax=Rhodopseudomonas palustris TaxID=1076 RepID=UPI0020CF5108|nr:hypothetical protein [Rhodopseudomonas palustris]MCP9629467.1 hypothetical protein [Rhodopseudomonas palustris]